MKRRKILWLAPPSPVNGWGAAVRGFMVERYDLKITFYALLYWFTLHRLLQY